LPKSGTTSLQDYLTRCRKESLALGVCYPKIGINQSGIAQHELAASFLRDETTNSPNATRADVIDLLRSADRAPCILISSEGLTQCLIHKDARARFLDFIREAKELNDEVYTLFTFRTFWRHMESGYLQSLKNGLPRKAIAEQIDIHLRWLDRLFAELNAFGEVLGQDNVVALDVEKKFSGSIDAILSTLGLREDQLPARATTLNVRLSLKKSAYLVQVQYDPCGTYKGRPKKEIRAIANMLKKMPKFETDTYDYHVLSSDEANRIQSYARENAPPSMSAGMQNLTEPESQTFAATDLLDVRFTEQDRVIIKKARARFAKYKDMGQTANN
jgi:hypothetical protein